MANKGKASKEVVEALIADIDTFIDIVTEEIGDIVREADGLSADWNDKQYEDFLAYVEELTSQLNGDLDALESVNENLRRALELY